MELICDYKSCTGCGACSGACPTDSIVFYPDKNDNCHIYPHINQETCIDCGLCVKTCPVNSPVSLQIPLKTYAAYAKELEVCNTSSSGGIAYTLSKSIIENGGVVYGSVINYGSNISIEHKRIVSDTELKKTQGSKYVHSHVDTLIYKALKSDIKAGKQTLFIGTGCQIAGIRNFLRRDYPNLFTVDIICHGVPSQGIFRRWLAAKIHLNNISGLSFRDKTGFNISVKCKDENHLSFPLKNNFYMMGFLKGLFYRNACYNCKYACSSRAGDITLGDFWGIKEQFDGRNPESKGTSVVMINNLKGKALLDSVSENIRLMQRPLEEAVNGNPQLRKPSRRHFAYNIFRLLNPIVGFKILAPFCLTREKIFYSWILSFINYLNHRK